VFLFDVNHLNLAQIWHCLLFVGIQDQKGKKGLLLLVSTTQPIVGTPTKGLSPGTKGSPRVNSKGEQSGFCQMWCVVELARKLCARQGVLSSNLTHHRSGLLGFKLFFSSEDGL